MKSIGIQLTDNAGAGAIFDLKVTVLRDAFGKIASGLTVGDTLEQNKTIILVAHKGDLKANPDLGVGLEDILLSSDYLAFRHLIREHFAKDGLVVETLDFSENRPLKIIASYE